ncbi:hypothetical protein SAMN05660324_2140 [Klenkia brasiliensis]|uniref:Uncharacterized protein n=2 Tax=Klenkia brasiliensis TaxID=333142 RepID=A0A1G7SRN5_9ACTN|nr:hypothetical protein SAMN05660324_2140 [Klenkia brasiliensis]
MGGLFSSAPVALVLLVGLTVGAGLAATAVRRRQLDPAVADARRHGTGAGGLAVLAGLAAAVAVGLTDPAARLGSGVSAALTPLAFAAVHTGVLWVGESAWPRPRGAVRTASLLPRRFPAEARRVRRLLVGAAVGLVAVAAAGWATSAPGGRAVAGPVTALPDGLGAVGPSVAGPYPGPVFAVPALAGTAVVLVLVVLALRTALARPAVPGPAEAVLRAASVHRVLRGAAAGLLVELGGLLVVGCLALRSIARGAEVAVDTRVLDVGGDPVLQVLATAGAALGGSTVLAGLALLLLPAPRLRPAPPTPSGPPPSPVPAVPA